MLRYLPGTGSIITDRIHDTSMGYLAGAVDKSSMSMLREALPIRKPITALIKFPSVSNPYLFAASVHDQSSGVSLSVSKLQGKSCIVDGTCRSSRCDPTSSSGDSTNLCACFGNYADKLASELPLQTSFTESLYALLLEFFIHHKFSCSKFLRWSKYHGVVAGEHSQANPQRSWKVLVFCKIPGYTLFCPEEWSSFAVLLSCAS